MYQRTLWIRTDKVSLEENDPCPVCGAGMGWVPWQNIRAINIYVLKCIKCGLIWNSKREGVYV